MIPYSPDIPGRGKVEHSPAIPSVHPSIAATRSSLMSLRICRSIRASVGDSEQRQADNLLRLLNNELRSRGLPVAPVTAAHDPANFWKEAETI